MNDIQYVLPGLQVGNRPKSQYQKRQQKSRLTQENPEGLFDKEVLVDILHKGFEDVIKEWFNSNGEGTWPERHPATKEHSNTDEPMKDTTRLFFSLTNRRHEDHLFFQTEENNRLQVVVGSTVEYLPYVHKGYEHEIGENEAMFLSYLFDAYVSPGSTHTVPARPVYPEDLTERVESRVKSKIKQYFNDNLQRIANFMRNALGG